MNQEKLAKLQAQVRIGGKVRVCWIFYSNYGNLTDVTFWIHLSWVHFPAHFKV